MLPPPPLWYGSVCRHCTCGDLGHPGLSDWNPAAVEAPELSLELCSCLVYFRWMQPLPRGITSALGAVGNTPVVKCHWCVHFYYVLQDGQLDSSLLVLLFKGAVRMFFHHISYFLFSTESLGCSLKATWWWADPKWYNRSSKEKGNACILNRNVVEFLEVTRQSWEGNAVLIMLACFTFRLWSTSHRALIIVCLGFPSAVF